MTETAVQAPSEGQPQRNQIVRGDPIRVRGQTLLPLVHLTTRLKREVHLRGERVAARGGGLIQMRPVGIRVRRGDQTECRLIRDGTARAIRWLALIAVLIPPISILFGFLSRKWRAQQTQDPPLLDNR